MLAKPVMRFPWLSSRTPSELMRRKKKNKAGNRERRAETAVDGVLRGPGRQQRGQGEAREGEGAEVWGGGAVA